MWDSRLQAPELIDLGPEYYSIQEYEDCLAKLDRVGRWLGGDVALFGAFDQIHPTPRTILDVGCGGGGFAIRLAQRYPQTEVVGVDINPLAIEFAHRRLSGIQDPPRNLIFECRPQKKLEEKSHSYDVVTSTLVCHHLSDEDLIDFISRAVKVAKQKVIFNDLHRHPMAFYLFKMIGPLFFRNRLIQNDGPLSVRRAFKYDEWVYYLNKAGLRSEQYRIRWCFPFRWLVEIDTKGCLE